MADYKSRIARAAKKGGPLVLACDLAPEPDPVRAAVRHTKLLAPQLCAIKLNLHLLLPLSASQLRRITGAAHEHGLEAIADIKLNDIGSTNGAAAARLWDAGFDAVIANPVMGPAALAALADSAHRERKGVIALCHMSAPEALPSYEAELRNRTRLYNTFLGWAVAAGADGIVVGATFPGVIRRCRLGSARRLPIYSPGVGAQGGSAAEAMGAGASYVIAGRSVLGSADPAAAARSLLGP